MSANNELGMKFAENHPLDAARVLDRMEPEETAAFLEELPISSTSNVLRRMNVFSAAASLSAMQAQYAARTIESLPLAHAVLLLRRCDTSTAATLLDTVDPAVAKRLKRVLRFREGTAGALADPQVLNLSSDISVGDAQKQLRRLAEEALYNVYITDRDNRLVGVISIRQLLLAKPGLRLESVMQRSVTRLLASSDLPDLAAHPAWNEFDMLPVVDKEDILLGAIRHKTIRQLAAQGATAPGLGDVMGVALAIANLYWVTLSGLAAGLAVTSGPSSTAPDGSRR